MTISHKPRNQRRRMDMKFPRKLNFNAPLLSIRHPADHDHHNEDAKTSERVPFSWEQAPGKPKYRPDDKISEEVHTPRPKPPPGHWRATKKVSLDAAAEKIHSLNCHDDNSRGFDYDHDGFSNTMDVLSLAEAIDMAEKNKEEEEENKSYRNGLKGFCMESSKNSKSPSPSFIIQRFLPDATALANLSRNYSKNLPYNARRNAVSQTAVRPPSLKGCGLEILFPWRTKNRLCGVKSPAVVCHGYSVDVQQPHCSSNKKCLLSTANKNLRDVNRES